MKHLYLILIITIPVLVLIISIFSVISKNKTKKKKEKILIGRGDDCDIIVPEEFDDVSRNHASIYKENEKLVFEEHSSNGSYINDKKVHETKQFINKKDVIKLGENYIINRDEIFRYFPEQEFSPSTIVKKRK
ncbi:MAG: FHA domain-containing protein [Bacteroidales bacterium]|jgi:pSer/pThr/pTyr-binding forkhead associated (FHA) protein|nr:FHA domain-containing protein [Bacteroidales bacterium]